MPPESAVFSEAQARRYVRDMLQPVLGGRILWALSADEAEVFRGILESAGCSDRAVVVDTSDPGFDASVPVEVPV